MSKKGLGGVSSGFFQRKSGSPKEAIEKCVALDGDCVEK